MTYYTTLGEPLNICDVHNEKVEYDAQKPEEYVQRVIESSSKPGDTVEDFFLGSGTTAVVANGLGRYYIGCDINPKSIKVTQERIETPLSISITRNLK